MAGPNIQPIRVLPAKYAHPAPLGFHWLPWPRGSAEANRYFNERRARRNRRLNRSR